jgi:hypothetical protein
MFESRPGHHAVLDGKQSQQQRVDDQRRTKRTKLADVDRLRHRKVGDESDGVEDRAQEHQITENTVKN